MTFLHIVRRAFGWPDPRPGESIWADKNEAWEIKGVSAEAPLANDALSGQALVDLRSAAGAGNAEAQRRLGLAYFRGMGVPRDHAECFMWFSLAGENGDPVAVKNGPLIQQGLSVEAAAEGRRRLAQFKGLPEPQSLNHLPEDRSSTARPGASIDASGSPFAPGPSGENQEVYIEPASAYAAVAAPLPSTRKRLWLAAAVASGVALCGLVVALILIDSSRQPTASFVTTEGLAGAPGYLQPKTADRFEIPPPTQPQPQPEYQSLNEIKLAAEQGKVRAQFLLGLAYAKGEGVPQDLVLAAKWYQKAGTQGDPNAQNNLGVLYVQGTGVDLNPVAAYACFSLAARGGVTGAAGNRDQLARILTADQLSEAVRMANRGAGDLEGKP